MYAVLVSVDIEPDRAGDAQALLEDFTIPAVRSQDGFVRGLWIRSGDRTSGRGVVLFDTEEHAAAAAVAAAQGPPPGAPVTVRSAEVLEVVGEA